MNDPTDRNRRAFLSFAAGAAAASAIPFKALPKPMNATGSDIVMMDGTALSRAIHTKQLSCVETMTAYLAHIERLNARVNALVALQDPDELLKQAKERDAQLARGEYLGPLHGIPHAVKDLQPVKDIRTTQGSPIFKDFVPATDSLMVERLRTAGAIFIGKTNTPEFGLGSHTITLSTESHVTLTTNPAQRAAAAGERRSPSPCAWCPLPMAPTLAAACAIRRAGITCSVYVRVSGACRATAGTHGFHR